MGTKPVIPLIFSLSSPIMLSLAVQSLYNIIDSIYISHYSSSGLTALSLAFPIQTLITAVASGTGVGTNILISNALGKNDREKASRLVLHGYVLSLINWILFVIIGILLLKPYFSIFSSAQEVNELGIQYLRIILIGSISPFLENVAIKVLQATGNTVSPMIYQVCAAIINLVLDPILIWGIGIFPSMGISGAAIATIFAQFVSALLSVLTVFFKQNILRITLNKFFFSLNYIKEIFITGLPSVLGMALVSAYISGLNGILAGFSQEAVSSLGVYYKLQTFLYLPANGIIQGIRPLVGYNYGAKEYRRVNKIYLTTLAIDSCIMVLGTIICLLIPGQLIGLFTENPQTIQAGSLALRIISGGFLVSTLSITACGALEGLGKGTPSLIISLLRYVVIIIPAAFLLGRVFGPAGVWNAFWIAEAVTGGISVFIYRRAVRIR